MPSANGALADFIAPRAAGIADYIGGFIVTADLGEDEIANRFRDANDDYSSIMAKALADRLAEAFAERLHARVRRKLWGYVPDETLSPQALISETCTGIRPAPGYPAQPDHTEKAVLFDLLGGEAASGVTLTESFAMWPGASVCGLYFSHPQSHYFGGGKIKRDQVEDYARRKGWTPEEAERRLALMLNYDPAREAAGIATNLLEPPATGRVHRIRPCVRMRRCTIFAISLSVSSWWGVWLGWERIANEVRGIHCLLLAGVDHDTWGCSAGAADIRRVRCAFSRSGHGYLRPPGCEPRRQGPAARRSGGVSRTDRCPRRN
jgi:hypothetical protein